MTNEQQTCGKGLAQRSVLPAKLGELIAALSRNLDAHVPALDLSDDNAKIERDAYLHLAGSYRSIGEQLKTTAGQMAGYRDLPAARHNMTAMLAPEILDAFENFVHVETELYGLFHSMLEQDQRMLDMMRQARQEARAT